MNSAIGAHLRDDVHQPHAPIAPTRLVAETQEIAAALAWVDLAFDPAAVLDAEGRCLAANHAFRELTGLNAESFMDFSKTSVLNAFDANGSYSLRKLLAGQCDSPCAFSCHVGQMSPPGLTRSERVLRRAHAGILQVPGHGSCVALFLRSPAEFPSENGDPIGDSCCLPQIDPLTNLPNRAALRDRLEETLERAKRFGAMGAVIFIDLDGFKPINDTHGHECGDEVLRVVAARLRASVRHGDVAARIGGDEFVVLASEISREIHAGLVAGKLLREIMRPVEWKDRQIRVGASLGVAIFPNDGDRPEELLARADEAMYRAKRAGKNGYAFFDESRLL